MINIIREQKTASTLADVFAACPISPLLPAIGSEAWQRAAGNPLLVGMNAQLSDRAMAELAEPLPVLSDELYGDFFKTGQRLPFERVYFERRRRLAHAVMAALVERDAGRRVQFLQSAIAKFRDILSETSWTLPAHVWDNPTGKDPMTIDLFAGETANLCGELLHLLGKEMPADLRETIQKRLRKEYFENYLAKPPHWVNSSMNWNAVCHQGVLGAALAVCDDAKLLGELFHVAAPRLATFLSGFSKDGGTSEGPGYWGYGFGWFAELNRQLEIRTKGRLSLVDGDVHVREIAAFGARMTLSNGYAVNFSDNSSRSAPRPALLQYLGERFKDSFVLAHAQLGWQRWTGRPLDFSAERGDVFNYVKAFLRCPTDLGPPATLPDVDLMLEELGVAVLRFHDDRGRLWEWAGKGGHNAEHHNHNDVGSYLLNINGQRLLTETGAPEYDRAFFSAKRYESIAARSLGHPVPLINGKEQPAGREFRAVILKQDFGELATIALDLTAAYPPEAGCRKCVREFKLDKHAGRLSITDSFELSRTERLESALITESSVTLSKGVASITREGQTLRVTPSSTSMIREVETHPYKDHSGKDAVLYRIVLVPKQFEARGAIGCTVDLA